MPHGYDTLAEYYRAHRAEMELVMATGCTPIEARHELRRRAKERREQCGRHAPPEQTTPATNAPPPSDHADFESWDARWMLRD